MSTEVWEVRDQVTYWTMILLYVSGSRVVGERVGTALVSFLPRAGGQSQDWYLTQWGWIELDFVPHATVDRGGVTLKGVASRVE